MTRIERTRDFANRVLLAPCGFTDPVERFLGALLRVCLLLIDS